MLRTTDDTIVYSATDLAAASKCEWAVMRGLDALFGRCPKPPKTEDDMLKRAGALGMVHERAVLADLALSKTVAEIHSDGFADIEAATRQTRAALDSEVDVLYQAAFFDGRLLGYADFILRMPDGRFEVYDTKLARSAKITALLQLAAYSEQVQLLGYETGEQVHLWLGTGELSSHNLADILPVYRKRRARLQAIIDERVIEITATEWGDPRYSACGRCEACTEQVEALRDVLMVAGMRSTQRAKLAEAGILTIDQLAAHSGPVEGIPDATLTSLRAQAQIQLEPPTPGNPLPYRVVKPSAFAALPAPSAGDIFFDFEGDPLHQENGLWNLDYLFGLVEADETFRAFWAHDLAQERRALLEFLEYVRERRRLHLDLHIYHYASYERTHLLQLSARHGVGEADVADLLREGVLVDLYPIVRQGVRIGTHSYSLKKLEPLYMDAGREGVTNAADSVSEYVRYRELLSLGQTGAAAEVLAEIARYNQDDCVSTLRLRDWLLDRASEVDVPSETFEPFAVQREPDPVHIALSAYVDERERTPDVAAVALAAAAIDYHRRENNTFWWDHFARLANPLDEWADVRNVFVVENARVVRPWAIVGRDHNLSRDLLVTGSAAPGSRFEGNDSPFAVYDEPYPLVDTHRQAGYKLAHDNAVFTDLGDGSYLLTEKLKGGWDPFDEVPLALTPASPPNAAAPAAAIAAWGDRLLGSLPDMLPDAALDILRRVPPRGPLSRGDDTIAAIIESLSTLDRSYIAVQGPPGTGKTYTGSRVVAALVAAGWRVGVVSQGHTTVENMLRAVLEAGVDPQLVGKVPKEGTATTDIPWRVLDTKTVPAFLAGAGGRVLGGTQWTFSNPKRVRPGELDLLVIDEAGQFSLASTIASGVAAQRMLLLGDPQQLPQVSQGIHPEPVDASALGWLSEGHDVLSEQFGYFLDTSWRMHPALCAPVSALSYEGRLHSHASDRHLEGVEPGLHAEPVLHFGNSTESIEEAQAVVGRVRSVIGLPWSSKGVTTPLAQTDLIVVAPYNAQVALIRRELDGAGFGAVPVGTVDKFQGKEAAVAIVSLAASASEDVPRGLEFLLLANRLNVAISRAQWAAYLIYSPALTQSLPASVEGLTQLSAFITLVEGEALGTSG